MTSEPTRDRGMTLIELLVAVMVFGLIATVLSATITVVLRQSPETVARVDSARWEQNLGTWMPADLTSAEWPEDADGDGVPDDPTQAVDYDLYEPCAEAMCTWGENVVHLQWEENGVSIDVSYRYGMADDGTYEFRRIECRSGSCESQTLVRDMPEPTSGGEPPISVTFPPPVLSVDENDHEIVNTSGRRVSVTIKTLDGTELLSFTGGGTERIDLQPAAIQPPEFLQARSGCGGPITLIVDESGSLDDADVVEIKKGVRSFVSTFSGTPTQLQIIGFGKEARVLGSSGWNNWYDLSEQSVVDGLLGSGSPINSLDNNGATNWEDAIYRALYTETGQTYQSLGNPANPPAEMIVFFTDGMPTYHRDEDQTGAETPEISDSAIPDHFDANNTTSSYYTQFDPKAWYRAAWLLGQTSIDVIGVGVGTAFERSANLDVDTTLDDSIIRDDWDAPYQSGYPSSGNYYRLLPAEVALGDLIAGNDISNYEGDSTDRYIKVSYDGGWDAEAVEEADLLTTTDFSQFGGALESIALAECGGTLTVQTRLRSDTSPLKKTVGYEASGEHLPLTESQTSSVNKTAAFDISTEGGASIDILLKPRTLDGTGYRADGWTCRSKNVEITDPSKMSIHDAGEGPAGGIDLNVAANEAVACVLWVVPS
ncbi:MAG: prepilin-type N-terminal cleavage/methylation domain-containing protein [Ilumatobacter sp.]|nr:prepilin-type N-terminal cleavage/methylation domain-containing protein [Ilumatobacter sp.]